MSFLPQGHSSFITHLDWALDSSCLVTNSGDYEILYCEYSGPEEGPSFIPLGLFIKFGSCPSPHPHPEWLVITAVPLSGFGVCPPLFSLNQLEEEGGLWPFPGPVSE